jgi:hypothetical protein
VSKMCSNIPVKDCQVANSIEYCYCRGELCNKHQPQQQHTPPQSNQVPKTTRRPPPAPTTTPAITRAPKSPPQTRDTDDGPNRANDLRQSTTKPDELPASSGAPRLMAAGAALALLVCRHILTPNIA